MYQVGDRVLYGVHGICVIVEIARMRFGKTWAKYYCLQPSAQPDARYYVPVENEVAVAKMRALMDRDAVMALLHSEQVQEDVWISEENQRKTRYRDLLAGKNQLELLQMICTVYRHQQSQQQAGRKLHQCDENFLRDAERLLHSEFAQVLNLGDQEVRAFIMQEMGVLP